VQKIADLAMKMPVRIPASITDTGPVPVSAVSRWQNIPVDPRALIDARCYIFSNNFNSASCNIRWRMMTRRVIQVSDRGEA
jgi:hypothetical protein